MSLPNAENAEIDLRKLTDYCLSPEHPVGEHKAAVFRAALGLTAVDALVLRGLILRAAVDKEAVFERVDEFGAGYRVDFEIAVSVQPNPVPIILNVGWVEPALCRL